MAVGRSSRIPTDREAIREKVNSRDTEQALEEAKEGIGKTEVKSQILADAHKPRL